MKITKAVADKALHLTVAVWAALSPLRLDIGVAVFAALGSYHGGAAIQRSSGRPQVGDLP